MEAGITSQKNITIPEKIFKNYPHIERTFLRAKEGEELLAFEWAIQNLIPLSYPKPHPWFFTTYEWIVDRGVREVEKMYKYFGSSLPSNIKDRVSQPSQTASRQFSEKSRLSRWKKELSNKQVSNILSVVHEIGVHIYDDQEMPNVDMCPRSDRGSL